MYVMDKLGRHSFSTEYQIIRVCGLLFVRSKYKHLVPYVKLHIFM